MEIYIYLSANYCTLQRQHNILSILLYIAMGQICQVLILYLCSGRRKVHYTFRDDSEMVEEYDTRNNELVGKSQNNIYLSYLALSKILKEHF